jgi:prepilin-type N-terminal cleavage/methylation domain-containing protein
VWSSSPPEFAPRAQAGFSMIELAVAVLIITLLLGSLLVPLATQVEQRKVSETRRLLDEIREALIGFAIIHGRLPCPDTDSDPAAGGYGIEEAACSANPVAEGYLPWRSLGVAPMDAFGMKRTSVASPRIGDWRYRVDRNFAAAFSLATGFSADALTVRDSAGNALTSSTERPVAIIFSAGPDTVANGQNAMTSFEATGGIYQADVPGTNFDDILVWISRPILMNRMVAAGKLP